MDNIQERVDFRFDIYERINLDRSEREIKEIFSTELKALLTPILDGDYVEIIGSLVLNIEYFSTVPVPSFSFTHSVPVEIRIPVNRFTSIDCIEASIVNFNVEQIGSYVLNLTGVLSISEVEPEIQPMSEQILTEEDLEIIERMMDGRVNARIINLSTHQEIERVIASHRELYKANATLSFKKEIFKRAVEDIIVAVDFTDAETVRCLAFKALEDAKCITQ